MRIIYYTPPSTPTDYFWLAVKATLLALFGVTVFYFLFGFLGNGGSNIATFFATLLAPITLPLFKWAGVTTESTGSTGLYTLFLIMFCPALLNAIPMTSLKLQELRLLDEAYGPVKRPEHRIWFGMAAFFWLACVSLRFVPLPAGDALGQVFIDCFRLMALLGFGVAGLCFIVVGGRLYSSWQKSPAAIKLPEEKKRPKHLKVAIDNTKPAGPMPTTPETESGIYTAITAEIIQIAGRTNVLPTAEKLLVPLEMLQKAALMTRSGQFSHPDLKGLCQAVCAAVEGGKIRSLPDLKAAQALFRKPDSGKLKQIASELKKAVEN